MPSEAACSEGSYPSKTNQEFCPKDLFPSDITYSILALLAPAQLAVCARTSRPFYELVTPLLYTSTHIDFDKNVNQLFTRSNSAKADDHSRVGRVMAMIGMKGDGVTVVDKAKKRGIFRRAKVSSLARAKRTKSDQSQSLIRPLPLSPRFSFTTHLTLTAHSHPICDSLIPLSMPLLHTLRIRPGLHQCHLDFCTCRHFGDDYSRFSSADRGHCPKFPACLCPLISRLRPRRILLGDDTAGLTGSGMGLYPHLPPLVECIREIVIFVGANTGLELRPQADYTWLDKIGSTVERLTLIMQPREESEWDAADPADYGFSPNLRIREGLWEASNGRWRLRRIMGFDDPHAGADLLWDQLAMGLSGKARVMEVVGLESVDRDWTKLTVAQEEEAVRDALRQRLIREGWEGKEVDMRVGGVRFVARAEYDARPELLVPEKVQ